VVADDFAQMIISREGEAGGEWVRQLPSTVERLLEDWRLRPEGPPLYGMCAVVLRVRDAEGTPAALKVSWIDAETRSEPLALEAWGGKGAAALLRHEAESGAMLLERLDERRTLLDEPIDTALEVAAAILLDLRTAAVPGLRSANDTAARWAGEFPVDWEAQGRPCDETLLRYAVEMSEALAVPKAEPSLLHGDFHYANILGRGTDGWAAIDPKALAGDPAYEVVPLLRNRWPDIRGGDATNAAVEARMRRFARHAQLDLETTLRWCLVRSVDDAMWFQENGYATRAEISWDIAVSMRDCLRPHGGAV
jgi:streptomycin 6-kinase